MTREEARELVEEIGPGSGTLLQGDLLVVEAWNQGMRRVVVYRQVWLPGDGEERVSVVDFWEDRG